MGCTELTLLQTLHHANQQKVEAYILELIVGLHFLVTRARKNKNIKTTQQPSPQKSPIKTTPVRTRKPIPPFVPPERNISPPPFQMFANSTNSSNGWLSPKLSQEESKVLADVDSGSFTRRVTLGLSKSQEIVDFNGEREHVRLNKSSSHSPSTAKKLEFDQPVYKPTKSCKVDSSLNHKIGKLNIDQEIR